jgi:hypothetical protein
MGMSSSFLHLSYISCGLRRVITRCPTRQTGGGSLRELLICLSIEKIR